MNSDVVAANYLHVEPQSDSDEAGVIADEENLTVEDEAIVENVPAAAAPPAPEFAQLQNCGCSKNCLRKFDRVTLEQSTLNMREMEKSESDTVLLGILESCRHNTSQNAHGGKRRRESFAYSFQGVEVCVGAFRYAYDIGKKHLYGLQQHLEKHGLVGTGAQGPWQYRQATT